MTGVSTEKFLKENHIYHGDSRTLLKRIRPESIALSVWSPPYFVGKASEKDLSFSDWKDLLREVIKRHFPIVKPGGFLAINIADILCFKDESMPKIMAENVSRRKIGLTKEQIVEDPKFLAVYRDLHRGREYSGRIADEIENRQLVIRESAIDTLTHKQL